MTRATWADFVRWFADEKCIWEHQTARMHRCAHIVRSLGEAHVALASIYDLAPRQLDTLVAAWLASLRERGIEPPEEAPIAASLLDRLREAEEEIEDAREVLDCYASACAVTREDEGSFGVGRRIRLLAERTNLEKSPTAASVLEEVVKEFDRRACDGCPSPECRAEAKAMRQAAATIRARAKELT